jgi:hypothetical protein
LPNKGSYLFKKEKQRNGSDRLILTIKKEKSSKEPDDIFTSLKETFPYERRAKDASYPKYGQEKLNTSRMNYLRNSSSEACRRTSPLRHRSSNLVRSEGGVPGDVISLAPNTTLQFSET